MEVKKKIIIGISGASGVIYGIRLLEVLREIKDESGIETHLVMTKAAQLTLASESSLSAKELQAMADMHYPIGDVGAAIASGSFQADGMIIAPCSMKTLAETALGLSSNLLTRAADVCLKERKRLVLMVRETPLTTTHLRHMTTLSEMGAVIAPPVPAFYIQPESIDQMVNHTVGRVLDLFGVDTSLVKRWQGMTGS